MTQGDIALLKALIERDGIDAVLEALSEICGERALELAGGDASLAKYWASMEGAIGVLVPMARRIMTQRIPR